MTVALQQRPRSLFDLVPTEVEAIEPDLAMDEAPTVVRDGGSTLEALVSGAWEGLAVRRTVTCPVCDGAMEPVYGARALPLGGRCRDCGTRLD
jgi:hypothetical protein